MLRIRNATAYDQDALLGLMAGERLRPYDRDWRNFVLAEHDGRIVGVGQVRQHADGARELGALVIETAHRNRGLASRLVGALMSRHHDGQIYIITDRQHAEHFTQWDFSPVKPRETPFCICINYYVGQMAGWLNAKLERRPVNRLAILASPVRGSFAPRAFTQMAAPSRILPG
jgi:N-acetylglutamate synthase-like GNAT family acetyltransferase